MLAWFFALAMRPHGRACVQDEGLQIKGVKLQLPSHADRQLMAAAAATGLEETSQSSECAADSSDSSGVREPTTTGTRQLEGSSQPHSAHASSVKDGETRQTSDTGSIEDIAADASAGSGRLAAEGPDSVQASGLERRGTYMSPLLLAVATQDAAEPEQRQHDAASRHSTAVPAAFRMASDEEEYRAGPQGVQQHPAPSSAASVDFEDGACHGISMLHGSVLRSARQISYVTCSSFTLTVCRF